MTARSTPLYNLGRGGPADTRSNPKALRAARCATSRPRCCSARRADDRPGDELRSRARVNNNVRPHEVSVVGRGSTAGLRAHDVVSWPPCAAARSIAILPARRVSSSTADRCDAMRATPCPRRMVPDRMARPWPPEGLGVGLGRSIASYLNGHGIQGRDSSGRGLCPTASFPRLIFGPSPKPVTVNPAVSPTKRRTLGSAWSHERQSRASPVLERPTAP